MLNQLLSEPLQGEVQARYPGKTGLLDLSAQLVRILYEEWKSGFREPDAEEFLDYLDGASASDGGQNRIRGLFNKARARNERRHYRHAGSDSEAACRSRVLCFSEGRGYQA